MKKILALILAMCLLCMMAVGTTLTYFTDTDSDVNTMVVGKVEIEQIENYSPNSPLRPYIGVVPTSGDYLTASNAVTKTVTVKNTGSEAAYIRTLFAFEGVNGQDPIATGVIHVNYNSNSAVGTWAPVPTGAITVNGVQYFVYSFTYDAALASGATSDASLKQIALDSEQENSFYDHVGGEYTILVLSQAVQVAGFESQGPAAALNAAFPITDDSLETWFSRG